MSISYDFSGKVALITGSSSGMGAATAILFAKSDAKVVVTGRNADNVRAVAKQCSDVSPTMYKPLEVVADITKEEDLDRLVKATINTFGKIDILVNSAGIGITGKFEDPDYIDKYRRAMNTNLNSIVYLTHICVKYLEKTKGNVINISSVESLVASKTGSHYCMSKAALDMFTKCAAAELGAKGIRVNSINPGAVRTGILRNSGLNKSQLDAIWDEFGPKFPVGRCGESIDIAYSVLYLSSAQASFITGANIVADGGRIAANVSCGPPE